MKQSDLYQEYLRVVGRLKDHFKLDIDVDHKDIHTFYKEKRPLFKLFYGLFSEDTEPSIVVSFHINLTHPEAINWFVNIYKLYPPVSLHDSFIEDCNGETYLGEDAMILQETYQAQDILGEWLDNHDAEEIQSFVESDVLGRDRDPKKPFNSQTQKSEAIIEFERIRRPNSDDEIH